MKEGNDNMRKAAGAVRREKKPVTHVKKIASMLKAGGVAILPADTVYGIFAAVASKKAVKRIFGIKGRDFNKPLQVFFGSVAQAEKFAEVDAAEKALLKKKLPGPYTVIVKLKSRYAKKFRHLGIKNTIGVRVIKNAMVNSLIKELKGPLAATSANFSGRPSPVKFNDIPVMLMALCGACFKNDGAVSGKPSRLLDITGEKPVEIKR